MKTIRGRTLTRQFSLEVSGPPPLEQIVLDVLAKLERTKTGVYSSDDDRAFGPGDDGHGQSGSTREVKILDWLSTACQVIRIEGVEESRHFNVSNQTVAWYRQNADETLFVSFAEHRPPGPAAFVGEVVLTQSHALPLLFARDQRSHDALRFVLAHELVHVFEMLPFIVPAFENWDAFWNVALGSGCDSDEARRLRSVHAITLDDYGGDGELKAIEEYWPTCAKTWFNAFRRPSGQRERAAGRRKKSPIRRRGS